MSEGLMGEPKVKLRWRGGAKGGMRGMNLKGKGRPSGISLSKPGEFTQEEGKDEREAIEFLSETEFGGIAEGKGAPVIHIGMIIGGRGVSMMIRPLEV